MVEDALRDRIRTGEWKSGSLFPSRREICESYKVSSITATRVLSTLEKEGVIERVQGRGNFFNGADAPSEVSKMSRDIAIIAPRRGTNLFFDGFYSKIADCIVKQAHEKGREVRMAFLPEEGAPDSLQRWLGEDIRGIIFFSVSGYCNQCADLAERFSLPAVFVDSYLEGWSSIVSDHARSALQISDKLVEVGHRKIGYVGSLIEGNNVNNESERLSIFPSLAQARGLDIGSRIISDLSPLGHEYPNLNQMVDWVKKDHVTAIVCSTFGHYAGLRSLLEKALDGRHPKYYCIDATSRVTQELGRIPQPTGTIPDLEAMGTAAIMEMEALIAPKQHRGIKIAIPMHWIDGG